jgi:hypothetical protein
MSERRRGGRKSWRPFEEARQFARSLGLKKREAWVAYCKSGQKPDDIPADASGVYKGEGWTSWGDFLGTANVRRSRQAVIGKIQRVPLREVWKHEALDFTTWLRENIDVVSDVVNGPKCLGPVPLSNYVELNATRPPSRGRHDPPSPVSHVSRYPA